MNTTNSLTPETRVEDIRRAYDLYLRKENIDQYDILSYPDARIPFLLLQCIDEE